MEGSSRLSNQRLLGFLLLVTTSLLSCDPNDGQDEQKCTFMPILVIGEVRYLPLENQLGEANVSLGPEFAQVTRNLGQDLADCTHFLMMDGDAAGLENGTPLFEIEGYSPRFLLATVDEDARVIWEARLLPDATFGRQVLDINGRVKSIRITDTSVARELRGWLTDPVKIDELVSALISARVEGPRLPSTGIQRYYLVFELNDGIVIERPYWPDSGEVSSSGILKLPVRAQQIIEDALNQP
jgi:hypothetical protein